MGEFIRSRKHFVGHGDSSTVPQLLSPDYRPGAYSSLPLKQWWFQREDAQEFRCLNMARKPTELQLSKQGAVSASSSLPSLAAPRARDTLAKPPLTWMSHRWYWWELPAVSLDFEVEILLGAKGSTETLLNSPLGLLPKWIQLDFSTQA